LLEGIAESPGLLEGKKKGLTDNEGFIVGLLEGIAESLGLLEGEGEGDGSKLRQMVTGKSRMYCRWSD